MFRQINIKNNDEQVRFYLYKNRREILAEIPSEYIKNIARNLEEIDSIEIAIPKYTMKNGEKKFNSLYTKVLPKQQLIVESKVGNEIKKERFTLLNKSRSNDKNKGIKKFRAYSFEYTLKTNRCEFPSTIVQLKNDETHVAKGILDLFEEQTDWTIGYVDPKSRTETMSVIDSVNSNLLKKYSKQNIEENGLIFDVNYTTSIQNNKALYLELTYVDMKTYDQNNNLLKTEEITNYITEPIAKNIKRIRAYHYTTTGNRYGIKYIFTTVDNIDIERITTFTNIINKNISIGELNIRWETGELITKENVKYITIETQDDNYYQFLRDVQDQFNSLFIFDSYNKTISVIHRDNIGKDSNYILSYDNNILEISVEEQSEYPNCLKVMSGNVSISSENIHGGDIIYDFQWYIDNNIMSEELSSAYKRYITLLELKQDEWYVLRNNIMDITQRKTAIDSEIKSLDYRIKYYKNLLVGFIAVNDSSSQQEQIKLEIESLENQLQLCLSNRSNYEKQIQDYEDEMSVISNEIKMENATDENGRIFTKLDLEEYGDLLVCETYNDEYYSTPYGLYNNAKLVLKDMLKPDINFTITCGNLCKMIRNPNGWNYVLGLGDLFIIDDNETISEIGEETIRLVGYEYIPNDNKISNLTFTNKIHKINRTNKINNIGKQTANNSNYINNFKEIYENAKLQTNFVQAMIDGTLDATATSIRSRSSQVILDISSAGIFVSDSKDINKSLYLGCNCLAISEDGFKTSSVAINSNSITADLLMGHVILGNSLIITSENGQFTIGNVEGNDNRFGLNIKDETGARDRIFLGLERDSITGYQIAKLELKSADGQSVVLDENGILLKDQVNFVDNISKDFPIIIPYRIDEGTKSVKKAILTLYLQKYRAYEKSAKNNKQQTSSSSGGFSINASGGNSSVSVETPQSFAFTSAESLDVGNIEGESGMTRLHNHTLAHTHSMTINTYHTHSISKEPHSHTLEAHNHELEFGVYEDTMPSNISIYINNELVRSGINSNVELDVTNKLKIGKMNEIKITSSTNGRIVSNVFSSHFSLW